MTDRGGVPGLPVPGSDEQIARTRRRYARLSADERREKMLTEITLGVPKARSVAVITADDADAWDRIARDVRAIRARGGVVEYDIGASEDV